MSDDLQNARPITDDEKWFRHKNWATKRAQVNTALASAGTSIINMTRFANCGSECLVEYCESEKRYRMRANFCRSRHCEPCMRSKANLLAANLRDRLKNRPDGRYRFITLTLKHTDTPLIDQIKRLYASFRKLRNTKWWKGSQSGGAAVLEVKWQPNTRRWHPHLHVVAEGDFLAKHRLTDEWYAATGDSTITDVRSLNSSKDAAYYVAKYMSKGTNDVVWGDKDASQEWVTACRGVRTCLTYGSWRGYPLLRTNKSTGVWVAVNLLSEIARKARDGSIADINLLELLRESFQYDTSKKRKHKPPE